jgi:indolepyruvate ferredoxin oxidoreductase beta subunit
VAKYPDLDSIHARIKAIKNNVLLDADTIVKEVKANRSMNIVMLGAATRQLGFSKEEIIEGIKTIFERKGEIIVEANLRAFEAGFVKE